MRGQGSLQANNTSSAGAGARSRDKDLVPEYFDLSSPNLNVCVIGIGISLSLMLHHRLVHLTTYTHVTPLIPSYTYFHHLIRYRYSSLICQFPLKRCSKTSQNILRRMKSFLLPVAGSGRYGNAPIKGIRDRAKFVHFYHTSKADNLARLR